MISALIRSKKPLPINVLNPRTEQTASVCADSPPFTPTAIRYEDPPSRPRRSFTQASRDASALAGDGDGSDTDGESENESEQEDDEDDEHAPLLPIFSSAYLDALPVYNITHSIRLLIVLRCETTVSWEQLRSPQISQFLVKPILLQIRSTFFSRATLYALIANSYQFQKEGQAQPANVGVSRSRALIAELLAMRLLKEYSLRELIDALSYDFDPLAGMEVTSHGEQRSRPISAPAKGKPYSATAIARISTLEVAIKAQAKRFLAHPVVVQHLEAIWAGTIVFHSAADNLHRYPTRPRTSQFRHYGATHNYGDGDECPKSSKKKSRPASVASGELIRRSASLYDPSNASMFKLSRLRVPRYRQAFSTISYAIMLGLFVALLKERTPNISVLEVFFWFWMGGYMLDEIVGFSEQGFGLYIMSVWNAFDIGILILFGTYFVLRIYSVAIADDQRVQVAEMAYDILGSSAILLFPRLFAVLDHVRYFSQLLIAFRLMAQDLVAILVLIIITCSGFFVAFALSFPKDKDTWSQVVYILFQILMGFTPAAWDNWSKYNILGRIILGLFLVICHFLVVTILVTVLTNSFMTIVKNANEEHQFLFAVNTISSVKSEALFSYIAPSNLFGWAIIPLRRIMPFRKYVRVNRTVIKVTHLPILLSIFVYERLRLARYAHGPADLIEKRGRSIKTAPLFSQNSGQEFESRSIRVREPSVSTYHKDRALEEVFRRPFQGESTIVKPKPIGHQQSNVVSSWMSTVNDEGGASTPEEQPNSVLEQLEEHRPGMRRKSNSYGYDSRRRARLRPKSVASRSVLSNPDESRPHASDFRSFDEPEESETMEASFQDATKEANADESLESVEEGEVRSDNRGGSGTQATRGEKNSGGKKQKRAPFSLSPPEPAKQMVSEISAQSVSPSPSSHGHRRDRNSSAGTIIFKPEILVTPVRKRKSSSGSKNANEPRHTVVKPVAGQISVPNRKSHWYNYDNKSTPNLVPLARGKLTHPREPRELDSMSLELVSEIGMHQRSGIDDDLVSLPGSLIVGSFQTQMQRAADRAAALRKQATEDDNNARMGRLVLARMNTLEEGFKDILKEVKEIRTATAAGVSKGSGSLAPALNRSLSSAKTLKGGRKNGGIVATTRKRSPAVADVSLLSRSYPSRRQTVSQTKVSNAYDTKETGKEFDVDLSAESQNCYASSE